MLPSGSNSRSRPPFGCSGRATGIAMSLVVPLFGSMTPTNCAPKSEYQTCPSLSTITSCGSAPLRGRSYSVMRTLVDRPLGRGSVLSGYSIASELPRLTLARNSAAALAASPVTAGRSPRRALAGRAGQQGLRMRGRAAGRVTRHSQKYLLKFGGVVVRGQDPLERVAAHAHREKGLMLVGAGKAEQPLPV